MKDKSKTRLRGTAGLSGTGNNLSTIDEGIVSYSANLVNPNRSTHFDALIEQASECMARAESVGNSDNWVCHWLIYLSLLAARWGLPYRQRGVL